MESTYSITFQSDSEHVINHYKNHKNYLIEYNYTVPKEYCILYFSSNNLYYPNTEEVFKKAIVQKNRFEWYGTRVDGGYKHIFLRDIKKQWYIDGINSNLNNPIKLLDFLREETRGYKTIFVGSSAGGFISIILGQQLKADRIYSFNGQFEIRSLLNKHDVVLKNPVVYRNKDNYLIKPYYSASEFITNPETVFYFHSLKSDWDIYQYQPVKHININTIKFITKNHGIPFLKSNLDTVLNMPLCELLKISGKTFHPIIFSLRITGLKNTILGILDVAKTVIRSSIKR